jgi:hypothetical protein
MIRSLDCSESLISTPKENAKRLSVTPGLHSFDEIGRGIQLMPQYSHTNLELSKFQFHFET